MKTQLIPINKIVVDKEIYPRTSSNIITIQKYYSNMRAGSIFPPIATVKINDKYILIDGLHRIEANKLLKEKFISSEILNIKDKKEMFIESVRRNITNGLYINTYDITKIILKLKEYKYDNIKISKIVKIPADKIERFVSKRVTRLGNVFDNNATETEFTGQILKKPLYNLAGRDEINQPFEDNNLGGMKQSEILDNLIYIIENNFIDEKLSDKYLHLLKILERWGKGKK